MSKWSTACFRGVSCYWGEDSSESLGLGETPGNLGKGHLGSCWRTLRASVFSKKPEMVDSCGNYRKKWNLNGTERNRDWKRETMKMEKEQGFENRDVHR